MVRDKIYKGGNSYNVKQIRSQRFTLSRTSIQHN